MEGKLGGLSFSALTEKGEKNASGLEERRNRLVRISLPTGWFTSSPFQYGRSFVKIYTERRFSYCIKALSASTVLASQ